MPELAKALTEPPNARGVAHLIQLLTKLNSLMPDVAKALTKPPNARGVAHLRQLLTKPLTKQPNARAETAPN